MLRRVLRCGTCRTCRKSDTAVVLVLLLCYVTIFHWSSGDDGEFLHDPQPSLLKRHLNQEKDYVDVSNMVYRPPYNRSTKGKEFTVNTHLLKKLLVPENRYITLNADNAEDFVFATGSSAAFFEMLISTVASIQHHRPQNKIIVYDLGLYPSHVLQVKQWCNVIYKKFNFTHYPSHVRKLFTYSWKPLVILDALKEYPGVLWMDTSVRVITSNFTGLLHDIVESKGGLSLSTTGHSTFAATHPAMYEYLPTDMDAIKREEQREATLMFYRTKEMYDNVLRWLAMCALQKQCISPTLARVCWFGDDNYRKWGKCHRFDQSAVNILFLNYFNHNSWNYYAKSRVVKIERYVSQEYKLKSKNCARKATTLKVKYTNGLTFHPAIYLKDKTAKGSISGR